MQKTGRKMRVFAAFRWALKKADICPLIFRFSLAHLKAQWKFVKKSIFLWN